jgi:hypothetical protein
MTEKSNGRAAEFDVKTLEGYLGQLYQNSVAIVVDELRGEVVAEFIPQLVDDWNPHGKSLPSFDNTSIQILNAVIIRTAVHDLAFVLGKRKSDTNDHEDLTFKFGFVLHGGRKFRDDEHAKRLEYLRRLTQRSPDNLNSGAITNESGRIVVDCWTDLYGVGGFRLHALSQEELLSQNGLKASVDLVRRFIAQN